MVSYEEVKWVKLVQEYVTLEEQLKELEGRVEKKEHEILKDKKF